MLSGFFEETERRVFVGQSRLVCALRPSLTLLLGVKFFNILIRIRCMRSVQISYVSPSPPALHIRSLSCFRKGQSVQISHVSPSPQALQIRSLSCFRKDPFGCRFLRKIQKEIAAQLLCRASSHLRGCYDFKGCSDCAQHDVEENSYSIGADWNGGRAVESMTFVRTAATFALIGTNCVLW